MKLIIQLNGEEFEVPNTICQFCNEETPLRPDVKDIFCMICRRKIGSWIKGDFVRKEGKLMEKMKEIYNSDKVFVYNINCD